MEKKERKKKKHAHGIVRQESSEDGIEFSFYGSSSAGHASYA